MVNTIPALSRSFDATLQQKIDAKTKPLGALGALELLALRIGRIQQSLAPQLRAPHLLLFAADHGAVAEGISAYPKDVTWQMVENILSGGAASSILARQLGVSLSVVDAGVDREFAPRTEWVNEFIDAKIARGTANFVIKPAMTGEQCAAAIARGAALVKQRFDGGCNVIAFGEMGIGNTSSAALLMHALANVPLQECIGRGTGLDDAGLARKRITLQRARDRVHAVTGPEHALAEFGGFEIAMMVGAMIEAARLRMTMLIDGFIVSAALLAAVRMEPHILDCCIFAHESDEAGHRLLLACLGAKPLLALNMRLGEGTGALLAYPLLQAAIALMNEMASFDSASVSRKSAT